MIKNDLKKIQRLEFVDNRLRAVEMLWEMCYRLDLLNEDQYMESDGDYIEHYVERICKRND